MIWLILIMGVVMGGGTAIALWVFRQMPTDRVVSPFQNGTFFKEFNDDLVIDRPKPESYEE